MARVLFLQNHDTECLGPMYISAWVKRHGHECRMAIGARLKDFRPAIEDCRPHLAAFSVMTGGHQWAREMAGQIAQAYGLPNVFGGPHPTFFPGFLAEDHVDAIVRGEGEEAMLDILNRLDAGEPYDGIANVCFKRAGQRIELPPRCLRASLDEYPFPDRSLYDVLDGRVDRSVPSVITSRGCPFSCSFCFEEPMRQLYRDKGIFVRIRRADQVIAECRQIMAERNVRTFYFSDDVFGIDRKWLFEFLEAYREQIGLPFFCLARADILARSPRHAEKLAEAGCHSVFFGIESGRERIRNEVLNKSVSDDQIVRAAEYLHRTGIKFRTYNMLGLPGETLDDAYSTVDMNIRIRTDYPWCSIFTPYPGTALAGHASRLGYLPPDFDVASLSESFFVDSPLRMPHIREMQNLQKFFQTAVLWPWTFPWIKRLIRFRPNLLFSLWFGLVYFLTYVRSERRGFWRTLRFALRNAKHIL